MRYSAFSSTLPPRGTMKIVPPYALQANLTLRSMLDKEESNQDLEISFALIVID